MDLKPEPWVKHPEQADIELKGQDTPDLEEDYEEEEERLNADVDAIPEQAFTVGRVRIEGASGVAFLMAENCLMPDGLVADRTALKRAVLGRKRAPVWLGDRLLGRVDQIRYDRIRKGVIAYFTLLNPHEKFPVHRYVALPMLEDQGFACGTCGLVFHTGNRPCSCIETTSAYILQKISIIGVRFWDERKDNDMGERLREEMRLRYFGGALATIQFTDPI